MSLQFFCNSVCWRLPALAHSGLARVLARCKLPERVRLEPIVGVGLQGRKGRAVATGCPLAYTSFRAEKIPLCPPGFVIPAMKSLGRLLQIGGLVLLPLAMLMELSGQLGRSGVAELLLMLVVGAGAFVLGRLIEGYAR